MQCRYCRAWNSDEEHRCVRCGRRLHLANARPAPDTYPIQTATAPAMAEMARSAQGPQASEGVVEPQPTRVVYQRPLFREMHPVMTIPLLPPEEPKERRKSSRPARSRLRRPHPDQQALDLTSPRVRTSLQAVLYCDAPVALPLHRFLAAALDLSMVLIALGLFLLTFQLAGGVVVLNKQTIPMFAGIAAILGFFYQLLFCMASGDTPGMRWTQLQTLNFDGNPPGREQRAYRLLASYLSIVSAGLGIIWALVDEEKLAWHDHISKTFPSPHG
jgi:uncharacterized RDD family membrane protein YckC